MVKVRGANSLELDRHDAQMLDVLMGGFHRRCKKARPKAVFFFVAVTEHVFH